MLEFEYENGRRYCSTRSVSSPACLVQFILSTESQGPTDRYLGKLYVLLSQFRLDALNWKTDQVRMPNDEEEQDRMDIVKHHS